MNNGLIATAQPSAPPTPQGRKIMPSTADYKHDYDNYINKATMLVHSPDTSPAIQNLLTGPDPVQKVADATVMVMQRLDSAARQAGVEVQDSVKIFGANAIVRLIVELGEAAGKFKLDESLIELALSVSVQDYVKGEISAHRIDPQKLNVAMQADIRKLPPKQRKEIQLSQQRVMVTARKYNHGANMTSPASQQAPTVPQQPSAQPQTPPQQG